MMDNLESDPGKLNLDFGDWDNRVDENLDIRLDDNQWHHLTLIRATARQQILLYVDGILRETLTDPTRAIYNGYPIFIGNHHGRTYEFSIDELYIFDKVLSIEDVKKLSSLLP